MRHLTCLEGLEICNCREFVFSCNMNNLTSLRRLTVQGPNENVLDGLEGFPSLQSLSLYHFPSLTSLPDCLSAMTSLQRLKIDDFPELSSLPDKHSATPKLAKVNY
jgi:hypothetical protein